MSEHGEIRAALEAQLATVSGIPDADHRAGENGTATGLPFTPPVGDPWLSTRLLFFPDRVLTLPANGGIKQRDGIYRLLLRYPPNTGVDAADTLAQAIVDAFPKGLTLTSGSTAVQLDGASRGAGGIDIDPKCYTVPVDIRWHIHTTNTVP